MINLFTIGSKKHEALKNVTENLWQGARGLYNQGMEQYQKEREALKNAENHYKQTGRVPYGYSVNMYTGKIQKSSQEHLKKIDNLEETQKSWNISLPSETTNIPYYRSKQELDAPLPLKALRYVSKGAKGLSDTLGEASVNVKKWGYGDGREEKMKAFIKEHLEKGYSKEAILQAMERLDKEGKFLGDWKDNPMSGTVGSVLSGLAGAGASLESGIHHITGAVADVENKVKEGKEFGDILGETSARMFRGGTEMFGGAAGLAMSTTGAGLALNTAFSSDTVAEPMNKYVAQPMRDATAWTQEFFGFDPNSEASKHIQEGVANIGPDLLQFGAYKSSPYLKKGVVKVGEGVKNTAAVGEKISPYTEKITEKIPNRAKIWEKIEAKGLQEIYEAVNPTTKENKAQLAKRVQDLLPYIDENKIFGNDLETIKSRIDADMQTALDGMKQYEQRGLKGEVKTQPIIDALKNRFMEKIGESYIDNDGAKMAHDLIQVLEGFGASVKGNDIIKIRRSWDKIIENNKGFAQSAETKTKGMVYETANKFFRNEIKNANPEYAKHLADYARTIALSDIVGATIERRIGQTRAGYIRQGLENTARVMGGGIGAVTGGIPGAVIGGLATEGLMRGVGKLTGSSAKLAIAKKVLLKNKKETGIGENKKLLTTKRGVKLLKNTETQKKNSLGTKDINPTSSNENIIGKNVNKSNSYKKIDGSIIEYKKPENKALRNFKKESFKTNEQLLLTSKEKTYLNTLDDVQLGKTKVGVIGIDKDLGKVVMDTGIYEKIWKKHGPINNRNMVATVNRWKYKIINRGGNPDVVNYIKPFSKNSEYGLLVGATKNKNGLFVTTHYEPRVKIAGFLNKEQSKGGIITTKNKPSEKLSYINRNLDAPTISQTEVKNIVRKYFKDDQVAVKLADRIVTNDGIEAFGMYKDKMIAFAKNPTKYTPEHEVFHAYFDMALKPKEKNIILKTIQKQENFKTKLDAEEFMADAFAEFVVGRRERSKHITGKLQNIFQDLVYMFKNFFSKAEKVEGLYRELESVGRGKTPLKPGKSSEKLLIADKGAKLLANTSRKFDENFRKISEEKMIKLQEKMKSPDLYKIRYNLSPKVKEFFRKNNIEQKIRHHIISNYGVRHILKQHGIHSGDKNPVTLEDIRHIPEIFSNPDDIFLSPKRNSRGQEVIIYEKKIGKFYYYFEDINTKTQQLETQTMYITDKRKNFK